jgi:hypothetical protein
MNTSKPYNGTRFCIDCGLRVAALTQCSTTGDLHGPAAPSPRWVDGGVRVCREAGPSDDTSEA